MQSMTVRFLLSVMRQKERDKKHSLGGVYHFIGNFAN